MRVLGLILLAVAVVAVGLFIVRLVWAWVVPDIFAGAVDAGLVVSSLTWIQAAKIGILVSVLGLTPPTPSRKNSG